ncbi:hypothetical protein WN943_025429 [Citrus x changshan-huyou]
MPLAPITRCHRRRQQVLPHAAREHPFVQPLKRLHIAFESSINRLVFGLYDYTVESGVKAEDMELEGICMSRWMVRFGTV